MPPSTPGKCPDESFRKHLFEQDGLSPAVEHDVDINTYDWAPVARSVYTAGSEVVVTPSGGLPVVVWIHGGGYISGAANLYNGAELIMKSKHGVITVVLQYRLGLFGFLAGEVVKDGGWVQAYISNFGGDPTRVTIWGQSAGAGSVLQHIFAHGGNTQPPLFKAAMTSSTYLPSQYNYNDRIPEMLYNMVVNGTNCSSSSDTLSCLRAADVNTLQTLNHNINLNGFFGTATFSLRRFA
ncbi:Alpha/Beta hydrolase protein [Suillus paluster]|uniref:Alpha/Beta hydrolase protein n=1 Tax=Suillus paluster TaxID=48578 RepID=UPI001B886E31|nr:Alpha/Beta hydrolase protein [Suillus paluster]KAG1724378.1 Alpha/Beta hydrolase protein [Suillus paluster]